MKIWIKIKHEISNGCKHLLAPVKLYIKQRKCEHDWRIKGVGTFTTQWFSSEERRCCKCKKVSTVDNWRSV